MKTGRDNSRKSTSLPPSVPTIYDVAAAAGVSIGTVSKVLNNRARLRPETRERVRAEAERLGFHANGLAQSLLRGRSFTVGLLTTDSYGRFSIPLMTGVEDALGAAQTAVFLCDGRDDPAREQRHVAMLLAKKVDGIIVTARRTDSRSLIDVGRSDLPVLYAYTQVTGSGARALLPDDAQGARVVTEHLLDHGRRQLVHITGPPRFEAVRLRIQGVREALQAVNLSLPDDRLFTGPWQEAWGRTAIDHIMEEALDIDGVVCGSDQLARGVTDALREHGVRVPDDVAVVGFDNWEIIAAANRPPLTTIDMNLHALGVSAGKHLLDMIDGHREGGIIRLPCSLIVRQSCGCHPPGPIDGPDRRDGREVL